MAVSITDILETIRDNASNEYLQIVPTATGNNLQQIGDAITSDKNIMNEFIGTIINKIAFTLIKNKMFTNPLAVLKTSGIPMGNTIEELYVNPALDIGYQTDPTYLLKNTTPDGKSAYYGQNRKSCYPITINEAQLRRAFTSEQEFFSFYNNIVTSLYSGDNIDEFMLTKKMLGLAIDNECMKIIESDSSQPKLLAKAIQKMSNLFQFASTEWNGYNLVNKDKIAGGEKACKTFTPKENQVLLLTSDIQVDIDYDVLATMFHIPTEQLERMTILVDEIPCETHDIYAMLLDRDSIQIRDTTFKISEQYVGSNLSWNIWLHHWQFIYLSMFGNAVAFGKKK